jgi:hypothetical protein
MSVPFIDDATNTMIKKSLRSLNYNIRLSHRGTPLSQILYKKRKVYPTRNGKCNITNCPINNINLCYESMVVYIAQCSLCKAKYIGSTKKNLHIRIKEHFMQRTTAIYQHNIICHSPWLFSVATRNRSLQSLRWAEAILIQRDKPQLNRKEEGGLDLSTLLL